MSYFSNTSGFISRFRACSLREVVEFLSLYRVACDLRRAGRLKSAVFIFEMRGDSSSVNSGSWAFDLKLAPDFQYFTLGARDRLPAGRPPRFTPECSSVGREDHDPSAALDALDAAASGSGVVVGADSVESSTGDVERE